MRPILWQYKVALPYRAYLDVLALLGDLWECDRVDAPCYLELAVRLRECYLS